MKLLISKRMNPDLTIISYGTINSTSTEAFSDGHKLRFEQFTNYSKQTSGLSIQFIELIQSERDEFDIEDSLLTQIKESIKSSKVILMGYSAVKILAPNLLRDRGMRFSMLTTMSYMNSEVLNVPVSVMLHPHAYDSALRDKPDAESVEELTSRLVNLSKDKVDKYPVVVNNLTPDELVNMLPHISSKSSIGLDIEANSLEVWYKNWRMTIFSISVEHEGTYLSFWVDWSLFTEDDKNKFREFLVNNQHKIWTYNCVYEIKSMWRLFGQRFNFNDALILSTMDANRATLKVNARKYLDADMWESEVGDYLNLYKDIFSRISKSKKKFEILSLIKSSTSVNDLLLELVTTYNIPQELSDKLISLSNDNGDNVISALSKYPYEWEAVPYDILGKYCCYDSAYTLAIADMLTGKYEEGYQEYIKHPWLAAIFESNGCVWDDEVAKTEELSYTKIMVTELSQLILSMDTISVEDKLKVNDILSWTLPTSYQWFTPSGKERWKSIDTELDRLEELKNIFNPGSNSVASRKLFWDCYLTDTIKMATFAYALVDELRLRDIWSTVITTIMKGYDDDVLKSKYYDDDGFSESKFFNGVGVNTLVQLIVDIMEDKDKLSVYDRDTLMSAVSDVHATYLDKFTGRFAKEVMAAQYEVQTNFLNVDINDVTTHTSEFSLLFMMAKFKKVSKALSTYINGTLGRGCAYLVKKSDDDKPMIRVAKYSSMPSTYELKDDELWLCEYSFNSLSAVTSRWSSGFHCLVGNTRINTTVGAVPIEYMNMSSEQFYVNSIVDNKSKIMPISEVILSGFTNDLVELVLSNGNTITCTPNHRFKTIHGYYICAEDIEDEELLENDQDVTIPEFSSRVDAINWLLSIGFDIDSFSNRCSKAIITDDNQVMFVDV